MTEFFRMESNGGSVTAWFWTDADCDEPMGPFESREDAEDDHDELRGPSRR